MPRARPQLTVVSRACTIILHTVAEPDFENCRPSDFPEPRRVYAWIRYPPKTFRIWARAIAYTCTEENPS